MVELCRKRGTLLTATSILGFIAFCFFIFIFFSVFYSPYKYTIGIDAGSSHSELILYRWRVDKFNNTGMVEQVDSCDIDQGLASLTRENLKAGLRDFDDCLNKLYSSVPLSINRNEITIYLGATAGARVQEIVQKSWMDEIFGSLKKNFEAQEYKVGEVGIINGSAEGLYAWISLNYLSQNLFSSLTGYKSSYAILDQGGASAQIAQVLPRTDNLVDNDVINVTLYGRDYSVYTFSNLCFGANEQISRYLTSLLVKDRSNDKEDKQIEAACLPKGYKLDQSAHDSESICVQNANGVAIGSKRKYSFIGTGSYQQCAAEIQTLLDPENCAANWKYCPKISDHRPVSDTIYGISNYFYIQKGLGVKDRGLTKAEFASKVQQICNMDRESVEKTVTDAKPKFIPFYCLKSMNMMKSLETIYKFQDEDWPKMVFTNKIQDRSLGWLMGYIISKTNHIPAGKINHLLNAHWTIFLGLFLLFATFATGFAYHANILPNMLSKLCVCFGKPLKGNNGDLRRRTPKDSEIALRIEKELKGVPARTSSSTTSSVLTKETV